MSCIESSGERFSISESLNGIFEKGPILRRWQSHINVDDQLVRHKFPRTCFRHFNRFPRLRRPIVVIVHSEEFDELPSVTGFPYLLAAHLTSSEVRSDFHIWFSPGFQMQ